MSNKPKKTARSKQEDQELDEAFQRMAEKPKSKRKRPIGAIVTICIVAILLFGIGVGSLWYYLTNSRQVSVSLYAAGIDLKGMNRWQIEETLEEAAGVYTQSAMTVQVLDSSVELTPQDVGAVLDAQKAAKAIHQYSVSAIDGEVFDLLPYLTLNTDHIRSQVQALADKHSTALIQTKYELKGEQPDLTPAEELPEGQTLVITIGKPEYAVDGQKLYQSVMDAYNEKTFSVVGEYALQEPKPLDLEAVRQEVSIDPVDAVMDMETFDVTEGSCGYSFDLDNAKARLEQATYGDVIEIPMVCSNPAVLGKELSSLLFRDVLGSYSSPHTNEWGRNVNLQLSCEAVNGIVLYPGEVFSYNDALGERTAEKGYQEAGAYIGLETVQQLGGGICQISSTLYYSVMVADLEVVERSCHTFASSYMPLGMDATVNWGTLDFRFRNNTNYPIRIEAYMSGGYVHVLLYGTDEKDYYVKLDYEVVNVYDYKEVEKEYPPDNEKGYVDGQVISTPYTGYDVRSYRCKYSKETDELISVDYEAFSDYWPRDQVVVKIVEPETDPTEITGSGGHITEG